MATLEIPLKFNRSAHKDRDTTEESAALLSLYQVGFTGGSYAEGIELVIRGVLQSAGFLYITEIGDGTASDPIALTPREVATAITYLATAQPPSEAVFARAEAGAFSTAEGRVALVSELLGTGLAALSLPTSLIGSVALGIAIDDTAHFLVSYQRRRTHGLDPVAAAEGCLHELGRPIVVTSLMLSAGYLVLLLSGFATLREFGWLSALTMQICLWGDLLMLPAVLVRGRV